MEKGTQEVALRGHNDLVHDLNWSLSDDYLVSASADGSAKVWNLTDIGRSDLPDKLNYTENDRYFFHGQLLHASYVYSAKIFPDAVA